MMFLFIFNFSDNAILSDCESSIIDRGPGSNCDTNNMDIWWYWRQYIISPSCDPPWSCLTFSLFQSFRSLLHASLSLLFFVQSQHQRLSPCIDCVIYVAVGLVAESSKYAKSRQNAIYMFYSCEEQSKANSHESNFSGKFLLFRQSIHFTNQTEVHKG